jgi:hypothetical protein
MNFHRFSWFSGQPLRVSFVPPLTPPVYPMEAPELCEELRQLAEQVAAIDNEDVIKGVL